MKAIGVKTPAYFIDKLASTEGLISVTDLLNTVFCSYVEKRVQGDESIDHTISIIDVSEIKRLLFSVLCEVLFDEGESVPETFSLGWLDDVLTKDEFSHRQTNRIIQDFFDSYFRSDYFDSSGRDFFYNLLELRIALIELIDNYFIAYNQFVDNENACATFES